VTDLRPPWRKGGRPVVFHHGVGATRDMFAEWVGIVAAHHPIVRYDMRGFGESEVPAETHRWSMAGLVADLIEVATAAFGGTPVHVVGESIGGTAALMAAIAHPDRLLSATISNAPIKGGDIAYVRGWERELAELGVAGWSRRLIEQRFVPGSVSAEQRAWLGAAQERCHIHVLVGLGKVLAEADCTGDLGRLSQPLLVLMPDQSPYVKVSQAAELVALVPQAELAVFPGARHGLPMTHAKPCAELLVAFLDRVERGVPPTRRDVKFA
jgi:pimeloyl-ACP methyl ester carboxylesterase